MPSRPTVLCIASVALLCACSQTNDGGRPPRPDSSDTGSPPNISPSSAPGVAFNYSYQFSLADGRIAPMQEAHASACEGLGVARCRITGMSYSVDQNEQVTAELDLKLDPLIARQFGKSAQQEVTKLDGRLVRLDIGSSDEGQAIAQSSRLQSAASARLAQLRQELAKTKPGTDARTNLLAQVEDLQKEISQQTQDVAVHREVLASTPMQFHYYGRGGVPGFRGNPLFQAWHTFLLTGIELTRIILQALAVLIPLGLLIALLLVIWRTRPIRAIRHWIKGPPDMTE